MLIMVCGNEATHCHRPLDNHSFLTLACNLRNSCDRILMLETVYLILMGKMDILFSLLRGTT